MMERHRILAFSHIPKTAGMTLGHLLKRHYGCRHLSVAYRGSDVVYTPNDLKRDLIVQPFVQSIAGHSLKPFVSFSEFNLSWYTFLRSPIDRFISHYQHEIEKSGKVCSFREWFSRFRRGNWQTRMIAGEEDLDAAKQILRDKFVFVGLQEKFNESLLIFRARLELDDFELGYAKPINPSKINSVRVEVMRDFESYEAEVTDENSLDMELYEFVLKEIWPSQIQEYGFDRIQSDLQSCFDRSIGLKKKVGFCINNAGYLAQRNLIYKPYIAFEKRIAQIQLPKH